MICSYFIRPLAICWNHVFYHKFPRMVCGQVITIIHYTHYKVFKSKYNAKTWVANNECGH